MKSPPSSRCAEPGLNRRPGAAMFARSPASRHHEASSGADAGGDAGRVPPFTAEPTLIIADHRQPSRPLSHQSAGAAGGGPAPPEKKASAPARAGENVRAATTKAADDGVPAITPPHERAQAGGTAAAPPTAKWAGTTERQTRATMFAAPQTTEPTVKTMDERPSMEKRPAMAKTPIAGQKPVFTSIQPSRVRVGTPHRGRARP